MNKILTTILLCLAIGLCNESVIEGKTLNKEPKEIEWNNINSSRSFFPLYGYIDNNIVTISLYDKPQTALITIENERGDIIFEMTSNHSEVITIDMTGKTGYFVVTVEYDGLKYFGTFICD